MRTVLFALAVASVLATGCRWEAQEEEDVSPAGRLGPGYGELEPSTPSPLTGEPVPPEERPRPGNGTDAPAGRMPPGYGELAPSDPSPLTGEPTGAPAEPEGT